MRGTRVTRNHVPKRKYTFPFTSTMDSRQTNQNNRNAMLRRPALDIHLQPVAHRHPFPDPVANP